MTTTITVKALHGWPVRVTEKTKVLNTGDENETDLHRRSFIVEAGNTQDFYVWDGRDLEIHEIQPGEAR